MARSQGEYQTPLEAIEQIALERHEDRVEEARRQVREAFDSPLEPVASAWIELGKNATPEQVAEKADVPVAVVQQLFQRVDFLELTRRKILHRNFTSAQVHELVQEGTHEMLPELVAKVKALSRSMPPEWLEKRIKGLQEIDLAAANADKSRAEAAIAASAQTFKPRSVLDIARRLSASPAGRAFLEESGLKVLEGAFEEVPSEAPRQLEGGRG